MRGRFSLSLLCLLICNCGLDGATLDASLPGDSSETAVGTARSTFRSRLFSVDKVSVDYKPWVDVAFGKVPKTRSLNSWKVHVDDGLKNHPLFNGVQYLDIEPSGVNFISRSAFMASFEAFHTNMTATGSRIDAIYLYRAKATKDGATRLIAEHRTPAQVAQVPLANQQIWTGIRVVPDIKDGVVAGYQLEVHDSSSKIIPTSYARTARDKYFHSPDLVFVPKNYEQGFLKLVWKFTDPKVADGMPRNAPHIF